MCDLNLVRSQFEKNPRVVPARGGEGIPTEGRPNRTLPELTLPHSSVKSQAPCLYVLVNDEGVSEAVVDDLAGYFSLVSSARLTGCGTGLDENIRLEQPLLPAQLEFIWADLNSQQVASFQRDEGAVEEHHL